MPERLPGTTSDMVKQLISRVKTFDSDGALSLFTDTPVYQLGNSEVLFDKAAMKKSEENLFSVVSAINHEIKMMWECGDVVLAEMDVTYWRRDGRVVTLPCANIFRLEGDKFSELRIFMDVNPLFDPTIPVPDTASVFTASKGKKLNPPNIMKKYLAEHPKGK